MKMYVEVEVQLHVQATLNPRKESSPPPVLVVWEVGRPHNHSGLCGKENNPRIKP